MHGKAVGGQAGCRPFCRAPCTLAPPASHHLHLPPFPATRQVQDSEVDEEGEPPKYCHVSGATRAELTGYLQKRISQSRCKASCWPGLGRANRRWAAFALRCVLHAGLGGAQMPLDSMSQVASGSGPLGWRGAGA